jgi:hypothetical protein
MGVVWGDTVEQPDCPLRGPGIGSFLMGFLRVLNSHRHVRIRP